MRDYMAIINMKDATIELHVSWAMSLVMKYMLRKKLNNADLEVTDVDTGELVIIDAKAVKSYTFIRI